MSSSPPLQIFNICGYGLKQHICLYGFFKVCGYTGEICLEGVVLAFVGSHGDYGYGNSARNSIYVPDAKRYLQATELWHQKVGRSESVIDYDDEEAEKYRSHDLDTSVFEELMSATVLINEKNELVRSYGDCSRLLSIPVGQVTLDIFQLIRNDIKIALSTVLKESRDGEVRASYSDVPVQLNGEEAEFISIVAQPVLERHGGRTDFTAVSFIRSKENVPGDMQEYRIDLAASKRISDLEQELKITKDDLRQTVTELESTNAELQAAKGS